MNPEFAAELLQLTHRPDLQVLIGRWGYQPEPAALPAAYEQLTQAALANGAWRWLQDIRRRSFNDPQITQWLLNEYFPDMAQRLGGHLRVAYLVGPSLKQIIEEAPGFVPLSAYAGKPYAVGFFGDEGEAIAWLQGGVKS